MEYFHKKNFKNFLNYLSDTFLEPSHFPFHLLSILVARFWILYKSILWFSWDIFDVFHNTLLFLFRILTYLFFPSCISDTYSPLSGRVFGILRKYPYLFWKDVRWLHSEGTQFPPPRLSFGVTSLAKDLIPCSILIPNQDKNSNISW